MEAKVAAKHGLSIRAAMHGNAQQSEALSKIISVSVNRAKQARSVLM